MAHITSEQCVACHAIIHSAGASAAAIGAGMAQLPCSDNALLTPLQLAMTVALGRVFGIQLSDSAARAALASAAGATVGRAVVQVLGGWLPGVGNAVNACTAAVVTEGLGWILVGEFAQQAA